MIPSCSFLLAHRPPVRICHCGQQPSQFFLSSHDVHTPLANILYTIPMSSAVQPPLLAMPCHAYILPHSASSEDISEHMLRGHERSGFASQRVWVVVDIQTSDEQLCINLPGQRIQSIPMSSHWCKVPYPPLQCTCPRCLRASYQDCQKRETNWDDASTVSHESQLSLG
jgi:hypothetical protein